MSTSTGFDVRRIGGRIGAEILGVDLSADLGPALFAEINAALLQHKALVFRDQGLDDAGQLRFAALFGELTTAHPTVPSVAGQPNVLPVDGDEGIRANQWHTDVTFVRTPPEGVDPAQHRRPALRWKHTHRQLGRGLPRSAGTAARVGGQAVGGAHQ